MSDRAAPTPGPAGQVAGGLHVLRFGTFPATVRHGVSTRGGGVSGGVFSSLNLSGKVGDDPAAAAENRDRLSRTVAELSQDHLVVLTQVHGTRVVRAGAADRGRGIRPSAPPPEEADGLITDEPGVPLLVLAADCVPMLFHDPAHHAVGALHAGWRGTVAGGAGAMVRALHETYGADPADLRVGIGPAIGPCCYEVDAPVLDALAAAFPHLAPQVTTPVRPGHAMLDLQETNRRQLLALGVPAANIEVLRLCTACHDDLLFSDRKAQRRTGRFGALIALAV